MGGKLKVYLKNERKIFMRNVGSRLELSVWIWHTVCSIHNAILSRYNYLLLRLFVVYRCNKKKKKYNIQYSDDAFFQSINISDSFSTSRRKRFRFLSNLNFLLIFDFVRTECMHFNNNNLWKFYRLRYVENLVRNYTHSYRV